MKFRVFVAFFLLALTLAQALPQHYTTVKKQMIGAPTTPPFGMRLLVPLAARSVAWHGNLTTRAVVNGFYLALTFLMLLLVHEWIGRFFQPNATLTGTFLFALCWYANGRDMYHLIDPMGVIFMTGLCMAIMEKNLAAWFFLLPLSVTNHETAIVLVPAMCLTLYRESLRQAVIVGAASVALLAGMKYGLMWALEMPRFGSNTIRLNVDLGRHALKAYACLWPLAILGFKSAPRLLKYIAVSIPLFVIGQFRFGAFDELRIWADIAPALIPMILIGLGAKHKAAT